MSLVHDIGEWVEDDARRNTLPVRRSTILEPLDRFDCNPIATQRHVIGRHSLIRAESPPVENACLDGLFTTVRYCSIRA